MNFTNPIVKLYQRKINNVFFELNENAEPGGIVFLGDSSSDFFRINEFFHGKYVINRGIGGDTTDGVLKRMPESVYDLSPSKVFILIGTNDLAHGKSEEYIVGNISAIISGIRKNCPDASIYLESIYPVSSSRDKKIKRLYIGRRSNDKIMRINQSLEKLAGEHGAKYIDVFSRLTGKDGNIRLEYTVEGLHLTVKGYGAAAEVLRPYVME